MLERLRHDVRRVIQLLALAILGEVAQAQNLIPVGIFDAQADIGQARRGSAAFDPSAQTYLVAGSGQNMWNDRDDFHLVWKRLSGNFILSTRARFIGKGVEAHRKIGWTIRPSLESNSPHVTAALHGDEIGRASCRERVEVWG